MLSDVEKIIISVKGSGENKEGECAWAFEIDCMSTQNNEENKSAFRMEMQAVLNALRAVKALSIPAEIRMNNKVIAEICQEMHEGKECRANENLDLWSSIGKEMKMLESHALKFDFKQKIEKDSKIKNAGKMAHDKKIE